MYIIQKRRLKQPFSPTYLSSMECKLGTDSTAVVRHPGFLPWLGFQRKQAESQADRQMCKIIASCDLYCEGNERPRQRVMEGGGKLP